MERCNKFNCVFDNQDIFYKKGVTSCYNNNKISSADRKEEDIFHDSSAVFSEELIEKTKVNSLAKGERKKRKSFLKGAFEKMNQILALLILVEFFFLLN